MLFPPPSQPFGMGWDVLGQAVPAPLCSFGFALGWMEESPSRAGGQERLLLSSGPMSRHRAQQGDSHSLPEWDQVGVGHLGEYSGGPRPQPRLSLTDFSWSSFSFWFPSPFMCFVGLVDIPGISLRT